MEHNDKGSGKQMLRVTDNWFVYVDDPISLLYTDPEVGVRQVKYVKKQYAEAHFTPEEIVLLKSLRRLYPDRSMDWWIHADEIRDGLRELFSGNGAFLSLLEQKPHNGGEVHRPPTPSKDTAAEEHANPSKSAPSQTAPSQTAGPVNEAAAQPPADPEAALQEELRAGDESARFKWMEMLDDRQIVEYLEGRLVDELFYEFDVGGRPVVGISFAGTIEAAKTVSAQKKKSGGGIEVLPDVRVEEIENGKKYAAYVRAIDKGINFVVVGYADKEKMRYNKAKRKFEEDPFARRSVISMAQRNALRHLIPEQEILALYREWKKRKSGSTVHT